MKCLAGYKCTEDLDLRRALSLVRPTKSSLFIDVGSGEGHVLLHTARKVGCKCLGLEYDQSLVRISSKAIAAAPSAISSLISIAEVDAETYDFHDTCLHYNDIVVYLFLSHFGYSVMGDVLLEQFPVNTRIVTVANPIDHPSWTPKCVWLGDHGSSIGALNLYLYVIDESAKEAFTTTRNNHQQTSQPVHVSEKEEKVEKQLVQWLHPPPGSYLPRKPPPNTLTFPSSFSADEIHSRLLLQSEKEVPAAGTCNAPSAPCVAATPSNATTTGPTVATISPSCLPPPGMTAPRVPSSLPEHSLSNSYTPSHTPGGGPVTVLPQSNVAVASKNLPTPVSTQATAPLPPPLPPPLPVLL